jgi:alcohol dehydrogenase class IV
MAEMAVVDPTAGGNPVPLDVEGARTIYEAALAGKVG